MTDRGYTNLLSHLHRASTNLPITTIQTSISFYLAHLDPSPTPLSATVVSSPLFLPYSYQKLQALFTSFRHAVHLKHSVLKDSTGFLSASIKSRLKDWVTATLKGLQGGQPIMRLAGAGGLLLGLDDIIVASKGWTKSVEDEVMVALAEIMDVYVEGSSGWEKEFQPETEKGEVNALSLALILASQILPFVSDDELRALPLPAFTRLLTSTICSAFLSGTFLASLSPSTTSTTHKLVISPASQLSRTIQQLSNSSTISSVGPLSKLTARTLSLLLDFKPDQGVCAANETLEELNVLTGRVETDWKGSVIAGISDETDIEPETREITKGIWNVLKTLLFSTIMITDAALSSLPYVPRSFPSTKNRPPPHPSTLAAKAIRTLSHLSFVISQFGGVTTTSTSAFVELKKVFYLAIDILSADVAVSEILVRDLSTGLNEETSNLFALAKKAYALAAIEQLVPILSDGYILQYVYPLCLPHLSDPSHRETYESAHSVMLSVFAAHAHRVRDGKVSGEEGGFAERLVPFYTQCLIENSADGRLSTAQLGLAFSSLVRGEASFGSKDAYLLARFSIDSLLHTIHTLPSTPSTSSQRHRLHLTLISTISALPLVVLPGVLDEVKGVIAQEEDMERKRELREAVFEEIRERVGDMEREFTLKWWYTVRGELGNEEGCI